MIHTTIKKRTDNLNKLQNYLTKHKEELSKIFKYEKPNERK